MGRSVLLILAILAVMPLSGQESSFRFLERNTKLHRSMNTAKKQSWVLAKPSTQVDTVELKVLLPEHDPQDLYGKLRKDLDLQVRNSSLTWKDKNPKHKPRGYRLPRIKVLTETHKLTYPQNRVRGNK